MNHIRIELDTLEKNGKFKQLIEYLLSEDIKFTLVQMEKLSATQ